MNRTLFITCAWLLAALAAPAQQQYQGSSVPNDTVATLPTSGWPGMTVWCSDVLTSRGAGCLAVFDGTRWRNDEGITATLDPAVFALNARLNTHTGISTIYGGEQLGPSLGYPPVGSVANGTGAGTSPSVATDTNGNYVTYSVGTTTTGFIRTYSLQTAAVTNYAAIGCGASFSFNALSSPTETYWFTYGMDDTVNETYPVNGVFFLADPQNTRSHGITGLATNNWICCAVKGSAYQYLDSGLPISSAASVYQIDRLAVIYTNNTALFYTNGVLSRVISTAANLPNTSYLVQHKMIMQKTAGTTVRRAYMYSPWLHQRRLQAIPAP